MDAQMQSSTALPGEFPTWDFVVTDSIVPIIDGENETRQAATITGFLQVGSVPQLPTAGIPWLEFTTGSVQFNQVDGAIKQNLINNNITTFIPDYDIVNGKIVTQMVKV